MEMSPAKMPVKFLPRTEMKPVKFLLRTLLDSESSTFTQLVADCGHPDRPAALIDPVLTRVERDMRVIKDLGLKVVYVLDTHVPEDHESATHFIMQKQLFPGAKSGISKASGAQADILLEGGEKLEVGDLVLEVRSIPGHTKGCVTFVTGEGPGQPSPWFAITGHALLVRGCGRTDIEGADANELYNSVHSQILSLPRNTLILPGQDLNREGHTITTVREELVLNPFFSKQA